VLDRLLDTLSSHHRAWVLLVLFLAAGIEYLFPPFPGDSITLLGGVLVAARAWNPILVLATTTAGSVLGAMADYAIGAWIQRHPQSWLGRRLASPKLTRAVQAVEQRFTRHGVAIIAVNRFMPGIRALFFVAAGYSGMPWRRVLAWGAISAALWNLLIIAVGMLLGGNLARMERFFTHYTSAVWLLLILGALGCIGRALWRRRATSNDERPPSAPKTGTE